MVRRILLLTGVLVCVGCVSIPPSPYVVKRGGDAGEVSVCDSGTVPSAVRSSESREGIDPAGFTLASWNMRKNSRRGWQKELRLFAGDADLIALQEAYLTRELRAVLEERGYRWDMAAAFLYRGKETGVLTAARVASDSTCVSRFVEPLVTMPKTALVSVYPLAGVEARLLVVNAHLVNFSGSGGEYRRQVRALEVLLGSHEGPLIVAGDFNTWSGGRLGAVAAMAGRLGLEEVVFTEGSPVVFFGRHVDHVYYRGLRVRRARVAPVASSDHRPLLVEFSLKDEGR